MITLLIVGLTMSMRTDRPAADTYLEKMRATQLAQSGIEELMATLQKYSAATSGNSNSNWISQPGRLLVSNGTDNRLTTTVALHSGAAASSSALQSVNLNVTTFRDPSTHLITDLPDGSGATGAATMRVAWKYQRSNPALPPFDVAGAIPDTTSPEAIANPIVGRYAYWTDDESAKVNYNLAWGRGTGDAVQEAKPAGDISKIDLATALDPASMAAATAIHREITKVNPVTGVAEAKYFNSPEEARRVGATDAAAAELLQQSKFNVTHYNHDPNTTFFNEERIVLTTRPERAGWTFDTAKGKWVGLNGKPSDEWTIVGGKVVGGGRPLFLDIAAVDPSDSTGRTLYTNLWTPFDVIQLGGTVLARTTVDTLKLRRVVKVLNTYISRTDWPVAPGSSFQAKYYASKVDRLTQLSLNIIDYVRSKESTGHPAGVGAGLAATGVMIPLRGRQTGADFVLSDIAQDATSFLGVSRCPKITEIGMAVSPAPVASGIDGNGNPFYRYSVTYKIELHLPKTFGFEAIDLTQLGINAQGVNPRNGVVNGGGDVVAFSSANSTATTIRAGEYVTVTLSNKRIEFASPRPPTGTIGVRAFLALNIPGSTPRLELCPLRGSDADFIPIPFDAAGDPNAMESREVDDPRVNSHKDDWLKPLNGAKNSFSLANTVSTVGKSAQPVGPQQDTDSAGLISDASLYMPPPAGKTITLPSGAQDNNSLGQVVSAGELGYIHTGMESAKGAGLPWRTLRLQPNEQAASVVPDWAFIDLFTAPKSPVNDSNRYVFAPHETAMGGRVNLNTASVPFSMERILPLAAVMKGCTYDSSNPARTVDAQKAQDIARRIAKLTDSDSTNDPASLADDGKIYGAIDAFDSPGELVEVKGVADDGEKSEELARQVMNLVTTRGNVFSIYTVGQSLKQTPTGTLLVTAEQRMQAMIERYLSYNAANNTKVVNFAPVYFRTLSP